MDRSAAGMQRRTLCIQNSPYLPLFGYSTGDGMAAQLAGRLLKYRPLPAALLCG